MTYESMMLTVIVMDRRAAYSSTMLTDVQEGDIPDLKKDLKAFLEVSLILHVTV